MSIHRPFSRHLFTLNGNTATSGGSNNLGKGQFAIVNKTKATANGAQIVGSFAGLSDKTTYELRVGKTPVASTRTAQNSKPYASHPFKLKDVRNVSVTAPKTTVQRFDDIIVGYDGINEDTALTFEEGISTVLDVILKGDQIGFLTGDTEYRFKIHFGKEVGETDQQVIRRVVERLKDEKLPEGIPLSEVINVSIVDDTTLALTGVPYVFSTLTLNDLGGSNEQGNIQAQYPAYKVEQTDRTGVSSEYTILHPQSVTLPAYVQSLAAQIKGCEDCAAGYTEIPAGVVYSVQIEDDGVDLTTTVDDLPGFVAGSVRKTGQKNGVGTYSIVLDNELTDAEITTYVTTAGVKTTAKITLLGDVTALCANATTTTVAWVAGEVCYASSERYSIQLKDDNCDGSRLAELQAAYPNLVIEEGNPAGAGTQAVTLTGTSGTANINIGGVNYLATFATNLTTTAANFVTAHGAAITTATGATVTANTGVLTVSDAEDLPNISVANVSGNLSGTVAAADFAASAGGCQRVYNTTVITNIVCDECSPMFVEGFTSEAPADFDFIPWQKVEAGSDPDALMGIRLTGKPFILSPEEYLYDEMPFYETSVEIKVAGGYVEEPNWSFEPVYSDIFAVKVLDRKQDRDHLGAQLKFQEDMSRTYFDGTQRHRGNNVAKALLGEESVLENRTQYVAYLVEVGDNGYSQGLGRTSDTAITYTLWAPVGRHFALENLVNSLASAAGLNAVKAFGNNL